MKNRMVEEPSYGKKLFLNHVCKIGLRDLSTLILYLSCTVSHINNDSLTPVSDVLKKFGRWVR